MPLFEYTCPKCGKIFEELVFGNEDVSCPACHAAKAEKLISRPCRHRGAGMGNDFGGDFGADMGSAPSGGGCSGGSCSSCAGCH